LWVIFDEVHYMQARAGPAWPQPLSPGMAIVACSRVKPLCQAAPMRARACTQPCALRQPGALARLHLRVRRQAERNALCSSPRTAGAPQRRIRPSVLAPPACRRRPRRRWAVAAAPLGGGCGVAWARVGAHGAAARAQDRERGVVWEEAIIFLPRDIKMVFLSATLSNAAEFAGWVAALHAQPCHVVYTDFRPTPLQHYAFACGSDGLYLVRPALLCARASARLCTWQAKVWRPVLKVLVLAQVDINPVAPAARQMVQGPDCSHTAAREAATTNRLTKALETASCSPSRRA